MLGPVRSGSVGSFNVGLSTAVSFVAPLSAQVDALIAAGIGPFQVDLATRLNSSISAMASVAISAADPFANIRILLAGLVNLQKALQGALLLPITVDAQIGINLSFLAALSGTLAIQLGALKLAVQAAVNAKIPALRAASTLSAHLTAGPVFAFTYNGALSTVGSEISSRYTAGLSDGGNVINPGDSVYGVTLLSSKPSVHVALQGIIQVI